MSFNPVLVVSKLEKPYWYKDTAQFAKSQPSIALRQLLTAIIPYLLLMALMFQTVLKGYAYWLTLALAVPASALG